MKKTIIFVMSLILMIGLTQTTKADDVWVTSDTIDVWSVPSGSTFNVCYHGHGIWLQAGAIDDAPWYDWDFPSGSHSNYFEYYDPQVEGEYAYYMHCGRESNVTYFLLIFHLPQTSSQNISFCQGESYSIGSHIYTSTGTYVDTLAAANSCDSIVTTNLTVHQVSTSSQTFTECSGFSVTVGSHTYNSTGTYVDTLQNAGGCDSIVITNLTINQSSSSSQTFNECAGFTVTVGTNIYNSTGVYVDTLTNSFGCDSIVTTDLTINQSFSSHSYTECLGFTVTVDGHTYDATGTYVDTLIAASGCDSIVITNLTINQPSESSQTLIECEGFAVTVGSHTYDATGIYIDTLMAANGCDSIVTTDLTINQPSASSQILVECAGFTVTVGSHTYDTTGIYVDTLVNANGCDSIVTTDLTINEGPSLDLGADTVVINLGSTATLTPSVSNVETYLWSTGDTTSSIVVDSMGWYYLTVSNDCGSEIDSVYLDVITGSKVLQSAVLQPVYICPNPATDFIQILGYTDGFENIEIYTQDGRLIIPIIDKTSLKTIDISVLPSGLYIIKFKTSSESFVKKMMKL